MCTLFLDSARYEVRFYVGRLDTITRKGAMGEILRTRMKTLMLSNLQIFLVVTELAGPALEAHG